MEQKTTRSSKIKTLFTLRQRAAFALASAPFDSGSSDFDTRIATQHFHKLTVRGGIEVTPSLKQEIQELLAHIRNYSSHAFHDDIKSLSDDLISFYQKIEWQARAELLSRIAQG